MERRSSLVRRLCAVRCFTRFRPSLPPFTLVTTFTAREWRNLADAPDLGVPTPCPARRTALRWYCDGQSEVTWAVGVGGAALYVTLTEAEWGPDSGWVRALWSAWLLFGAILAVYWTYKRHGRTHDSPGKRDR
jgi:hypothetical protein